MNQHITLFRIFAATIMFEFFFFMPMLAQNYVKTETFLNNTGTKSVTDIQYYDGLGRPGLSASNGIGTSEKYVYTLTEYDQNGRENHKWLPVVGSSTANPIENSNYQSMAVSAYNNDNYPYRETRYDALDQPIAITGAGNAWHSGNKKVVKRYDTNVANSVKWYKAVSSNNSLVLNGSYPAGALSMEETTDEDGKKTQVFKDFLSQIVLVRNIADGICLDTYYVYNELNQLSYVLTPEYQNSGYKEKYAYEYRYDDKGRLDKRILPHCEYEQNYYDSEGRLIYKRDATEQFFFFFYDTMGRLAIKGTCDNFNYHNYRDVYIQNGQDGLYGTGYVYDYPSSLSHGYPSEVIYYDDYQFLTKSKFSSSPHLSSLTKSNPHNATGLQTGSIVRTSSGQYLLSAIYYDEKGRMTDKRETLLGGGLKITAITYSFTDKPLTETCTLTHNGTTTVVTKTYTYYNTNDQLKSLSVSYNGSTPITMAEYDYNDLGLLETIHRGGNAGNVDYSYNLRGWTESIDGKGFKEWLHYTDGPGTPYFSGNISSQLWQVDGENYKRGYKFSYDGFGRMGKAEYGEGSSLTSHVNRYTEWVKEYYTSGAVRKIERYGKKTDGNYGKIDNLRMYNNGLQLDSVKEDALPLTYAGAFDFVSKKVQTDGAQYAYYDDGSLKWDANKGISLIRYDKNRFPQRIQFSNGSVTEYVYSSTGEKLRTIYRIAVPNISVPLGSVINLNATNTLSVDSINYIGDFICENGQLSKYLFAGGYATFANNQPIYHYYTQDHLGNNRAVVNHDGTVEQITHYYPFGAVYSDAGSNDGLQRYKYNGKELDRMHGLNQYDYGARNYDPLLCRFTQMDPLSETDYGMNPFAYCGNNPVINIDPDGRDWFETDQGFLHWQPNVHSQSDLQEGYNYIGESIIRDNVTYRDDGTIMFPNESQAYKRMAYQEKRSKTPKKPRGKEQMAFILDNGSVLVMPDNWNDSESSTYKQTGINRENHVLTDKHGNKFGYVAQVHTHPLGTDKGLSIDDQLFAKADPGISVFVMHGDGYVYGGYYSSKRRGIDMWIHNEPIPVRSLIKGKKNLKIIADFYKNK